MPVENRPKVPLVWYIGHASSCSMTCKLCSIKGQIMQLHLLKPECQILCPSLKTIQLLVKKEKQEKKNTVSEL